MAKRDAEEMGGEERLIWHARGKETGASEDGGQREALMTFIFKCHNYNHTLYANLKNKLKNKF